MAEAKKVTTKKKTVKEEKAVIEELKKTAAAIVDDEAKEITDEAVNEDPKVAKAGKRSAKAIAETEEKQAKEERKAQAASSEEQQKPKTNARPPRSKLERKGKNYRKLAEKVEKDKAYSLAESVNLAIETNPAKFDATAELHIRLGVDPRHADQNIRDIVVLPAGTGKTVRIAVLADVDDAAKAKKAGADKAGSEEIFAQLDKGIIDFDTLIATPAMMPKLGKYAKTLGPKGLMPNPKSGTVTADVEKAISEAKAGRVEYRVDSTGIVHVGFGKVSFGADKLIQNAQAILTSIKSAKPSSIKGSYVKSIYITTSMGPSILVENTELN
jgi:large subunit ribosomal protein L1